MYSGKQYTLNHEQGDMNNMTKRRAKKIALREWELVKAAVDKDIKENKFATPINDYKFRVLHSMRRRNEITESEFKLLRSHSNCALCAAFYPTKKCILCPLNTSNGHSRNCEIYFNLLDAHDAEDYYTTEAYMSYIIDRIKQWEVIQTNKEIAVCIDNINNNKGELV